MALVGGCIAALAAVGLMTRHDLARLHHVRHRVEHTNRIQLLGLRVQRSLLVQPGEDAIFALDQDLIARLRLEVANLRAAGVAIDPRTDVRLGRLHELLDPAQVMTSERLAEAVSLVGRIVEDETDAQAGLWSRIDQDIRLELEMIAGLAVALPVIAVLAMLVLKRRLLAPLGDLRGLLSRLADGDFRPWTVAEAHPAVAPLAENYNHLVRRLEELEEEHHTRARTLEAEVRSATEALLEQQSTLARAERLAAVGETTANLAHELRNPLAGILMSLGNLRSEAADPDVEERLGLVIAEIERLTRMLNQALAAARHTPEPARPLDVGELVESLLALVRYQVPERIRLVNEVPAGVTCELPRDRVRQALINLILNSAEAIGEASGRIEVAARCDDGQLELRVCDSGPGFPADLLEQGIQAFSSRRPAGTGLGLAMVRRLALDLGGRVHLDNLPRGGACARVVVPFHHG